MSDMENPQEQPKDVPLDLSEEVVFDVGKAMLMESISVGREFCKYMIGVATGAVPVYLGLVSLFLPDAYDLSRLNQGLSRYRFYCS